MKRNIYILLLLLLPGIACATSDMYCSGEKLSVYIVVGSDGDDYTKDAITDFSIYTEGQAMPTPLDNHDFISSYINWVDIDGDFSANRLHLELKNRSTGQLTRMTANGRKGVLKYKDHTYMLDCNWER